MNLSQQAGLAAFNTIASQFNSGTLNIYNTPLPPSPESAVISGSIVLAQYTFSSTAFPSVTYDVNGYYKGNASFVTGSVTPLASGTAIFARAFEAGNSVPIADFTLSQAWVPNLNVVQSQYITANGNLYICTVSGTTSASRPGPTSLGTNIADGTAYWMYLAPGSSDILLQSANVSPSIPLVWPYLWLAMPCV